MLDCQDKDRLLPWRTIIDGLLGRFINLFGSHKNSSFNLDCTTGIHRQSESGSGLIVREIPDGNNIIVVAAPRFRSLLFALFAGVALTHKSRLKSWNPFLSDTCPNANLLPQTSNVATSASVQTAVWAMELERLHDTLLWKHIRVELTSLLRLIVK